jgi:hypothetical protein
VSVGDGASDAVYRPRDRNGDGDAMDPGEADVRFSEAGNAAGLTLLTPKGLAKGPDGRSTSSMGASGAAWRMRSIAPKI